MAREIAFAFPLPNGLHARPASLLRAAAARFASTVTLVNRRAARTADARSVLALLSTLTRQGDPCVLRIEGADEDETAAALQGFLTDRLARCDDEAMPVRADGVAGRPLPRILVRSGAAVLRGRAVSPGVARAPAVTLNEFAGAAETPALPASPACCAEPEAEVRRLDAALRRAADGLRERLARAVEATERSLLAAHLALAEDPELARRAAAEIAERGVDAVTAVRAAAERFAVGLRESGSDYLAARALDLEDVAARIVRALRGETGSGPLAPLSTDAVVVAVELSPDALLALGAEHLRGLVLARGGATSHTAILARALGIPAVAGVEGACDAVAAGAELIVDGERGLAVIAPPRQVAAFYEGERRKLAELGRRAARFRDAAGRTADGRPFGVDANVASLAEARLAFAGGAEGIGVFRTEMLFMNRVEPPGEEEQTRVYTEAVRLAGGRPVVVRTLDVGGDKPLPYLALPPEANPFLGYRAVRLYEEHRGLVATQVRAALRASAAGTVRLLLPMVCCLAEVRAFRLLVGECMAELERAGADFDRAIEIGVMVEIPALAFVLDQLAPEVDFFSVGTNDLAQYFLAVDRDSARVAHLYTPYHPSFLRLLRQIAAEARAHGRRVGVCGELGGDLAALPLLVGCGFDEVSVAPPKVTAVRAALAVCRDEACRALLAEATRQEGPEEVAGLLRRFAESRRDRSLLTAEAVQLRSASDTKEGAIRELVDRLHLAGRLDDADAVEEAVWVREESHPTGIGSGLAIPHCQSPAVRCASLAVARYETPLAWRSLDDAPVRLAILIVVPAGGADGEHLRTIAALSRRLMDDELRERLLAAGEAAEVVALLGPGLPAAVREN